MYVCMYVCMSHSRLQNQHVSEGVKFLIKTFQNLTFNSFLFWIVRGGTSRGLARLQTCMYVCLSSRPTLSMYVCTSDRPKQVCMYVCMLEAPPTEHVCMYVSGILSMYVCMSQAYWACMYVCLRHTYIVTRHHVERVCMLGVKHVCISQNLVFCRPFDN